MRGDYEWHYSNSVGVRYLRSARRARRCGRLRSFVANFAGRGIEATVLAFAAVVIVFLLMLR